MEVVPVEYFEFQQPPEAPVFEPSMKEFDDPISYISKIRPVAEKYGICRIIPPEGWRPPFSVDLNKFTFNPRVQPLKELEATTRVKLIRKGLRLSWPLIDKKSVDLFSLQTAVDSSDGSPDWCSIAKSMQFSENSIEDLKLCYDKLIKPFVDSGGEANIRDADVCETCLTNENSDNIVACVMCGAAYHLDCLRPQFVKYKVSKADWNCFACIKEKLSKSREPYGFDQAEKHYSLEEFGQMAVQFKEEHFGMPCLSVPIEEVEKEYWRLLTDLEHDTMVEYGADIHSVDHGMGFPSRCEPDSNKMETDEYIQSKWNLNNIPVIETSVYSHIGTNVPGVTIPWMYIGMCFSTFCWHIEDHWSYSINYLHWGEAKTWYGIPGKDAEYFETVMKNVAPVLFEGQPDLLHDLSTTVNPNTLMDYGLTIFRTDQKAGEFVVTFPRAYHAGFNQGFNFAEAVNFAPADWIPIGRACIDHYASLFHPCVFSHDELICKLAMKGSSLDPSLAKATLYDMAVMLKGESDKRKIITKLGVTKTERVIFEKIPDDNRQCAHCKTTFFLSAVKCSCREDIYCVNDYFKIKEACGCSPSNLIFKYRYDLDELLTLITNCKVHLGSN
ncbi:hypothetical protein GE061_013522 [Apolygus lucorum]|uniref:[histone H3]-trimethyl-L-lysine(4) demethylase n=1 Tax=Apolygus lucorum TaxID=248454 RepID=A0A8S9XQT9_APOLU|nr:hypothetical protein GE061_013522 [Apolygus lucorum]